MTLVHKTEAALSKLTSYEKQSKPTLKKKNPGHPEDVSIHKIQILFLSGLRGNFLHCLFRVVAATSSVKVKVS